MKRAFTLIELLIVISIISILVAILFPVLSMAKLEGQKASDMSNLRQIGLSAVMYSGDNDSLELSFGNCVAPNQCYYWKEMIYPYLRSGEPLISPVSADYYTQPWVDPLTNVVNRNPVSPFSFKNSYGYNGVGFDSIPWLYPSGSIQGDYGLTGLGYRNNGEFETRSVLDTGYDTSKLIRVINATAADIVSALHTDASDLDRSQSDFTVVGKATPNDYLFYSHGAKGNGVYGQNVVELLADGHVKTRQWGSSKICDWYVQGCSEN